MQTIETGQSLHLLESELAVAVRRVAARVFLDVRVLVVVDSHAMVAEALGEVFHHTRLARAVGNKQTMDRLKSELFERGFWTNSRETRFNSSPKS